MQQAEVGLNLYAKRRLRREFRAQIGWVTHWARLEALTAPHATKARRGRPPFAVRTMLGIDFIQKRFTLSGPAMDEAPHDVPLFRRFAELCYDMRWPDESTILRSIASA